MLKEAVQMDLPVFENYEVARVKARRTGFTVYEATELTSDVPVFIKILDRATARSGSNALSFLNNARVLERLNDEHICRLYDYGRHEKYGYFATSEALGLDPLRALILETFSLALDDLVSIFVAIGVTLRNAHLHGLVHGFLNPDCIHVKSDGSIKIDDFGFSWSVPAILQKNDADSLHLARYIAPEHYDNAAVVDGRADIYSTGMILYELLAGRHPLDATDMLTLQSQHLAGELPPLDMAELGLPQELGDIVEKCTKADSEARFQNLREYLDAFEQLRRTFPASDTLPESKAPEPFAFEGEQFEKYFAEREQEPAETAGAPGMRSTYTRWLLTGAGAVLLVLLALFVTNYIPLPFSEHAGSGKNGKLAANDVSMTTEPVHPGKNAPEPAVGNKPEPPQIQSQSAADAGAKEPASSPNLIVDSGAQKSAPAAERPVPADEAQSATQDITPPPQPSAESSSGRIASEPAKPPSGDTGTTTAVPETASLRLTVTAENKPLVANVFVNNVFVGKTRADGTLQLAVLPVGKTATVRVAQQGYVSRTRRLTVLEANPLLSLDLKAKVEDLGTVLLDATPGADEVYIDGVRRQGKTPLRISLEHGNHSIRLVNSQLQASWEQEIDLRVGQVLRVRHDFTQKQFGHVAISLKNAAQYGFGFVYVDGKLWAERPNTTPLDIKLPVGDHSIEVRRDGFSSVPKDVIVKVEAGKTQYAAFTFTRTTNP